MKYPSVRQIKMLHEDLIRTSGGAPGLRDEGLLESAVKTPLQTFDSQELYPSVIDKASRLAFGLITDHPFVDGNKRIGTHAMLVLFDINGMELSYEEDDLIDLILQIAAGKKDEPELHRWIEEHLV